MKMSADRASVLRDLDAFERNLRRLLAMIEAPVTDLDGLVRASAMLSSQSFDAAEVVTRFQDADRAELAHVKRRLACLADLDAIARATCVRELEKTSATMERVRRFRTQLDSMQSVEHLGETLDYTS